MHRVGFHGHGKIFYWSLIRIKAFPVTSGDDKGVPQESIRELDVRNLSSQKIPPLTTILNTVDSLEKNQGLCLLVPFEPTPLYALLASQGFTHESSKNEDGSWRVVFRR